MTRPDSVFYLEAIVITDVQTLTLTGESDSMEDPPMRIFQTVFFATPKVVTATATLSAVSLGHAAGAATGGDAIVSVWKVGIATSDGRATNTVDLSGSSLNSAVHFDNCVFVTFVLSLRLAAAVGVFVIYVHD